MRVAARVSRAISRGKAVVALESSVFAQGLPAPANEQAARRMVAAIELAGAVPAITAVMSGRPTIGIDQRDLRRFLGGAGVRKVSARDLAPAAASGEDGATTVAAALAIAHLAGVRVFATGGIGGVHRGGHYDESADLLELSRLPIVVVCSGPKAVLDLPATAERLETLGVTVVGYRTDRLPAFYVERTDLPVSTRVDSPAELVELFDVHRRLDRPGALLVVQPPPPVAALSADEVESAVAAALRRAARAAILGPAVTPFLLQAVEAATGGRSLVANLELLEQNARLAAELAVQLAAVARNNR